MEVKEVHRCPNYLSCSCNVCPLDPEYEKRTWFADEEICKLKQFRNHPIVIAMKKIRRAWEKGRKQIYGRPLSGETTWFGKELMELGQHELTKRKQASERMKEKMAKGEWVPPFSGTGVS